MKLKLRHIRKEFRMSRVAVNQVVRFLVDFLECWESWTACIGSGRIVQRHGMGSIVAKKTNNNPRGHCCSRFVDLACIVWNAGSHNGLNVLDRSHLFDKLSKDESSTS